MRDMLANDSAFIAVATFFIFWLGCCIGSFLNVCIWRIPRGESIVHPPSHCPSCNNAIPFWLNIPLVSWCMLKGRCRFCKAPIAPRYVVVELIAGLLFLAVWAVVVRNGMLCEFLPGWLTFISILFCCSVIDWEQQIIPNKITSFGVVAGLLFSGIFPIMQGVQVEGVVFPLQNAFFMPFVKRWFATKGFMLDFHPWLEGLLASFMGLLVGYLLIALFIESGKLLLGREKVAVSTAVDFDFVDGTLILGEEEVVLDDILYRKSDRVVVTLAESSAGAGVLQIFEDTFFFNGKKVELEKLPKAMKAEKWVLPREVMGYGDAKLLAVCGAFMGPEGALLTLAGASVLASILVFPYVLLTRNKKIVQVPFGGYISVGAFLLLVLFAM